MIHEHRPYSRTFAGQYRPRAHLFRDFAQRQPGTGGNLTLRLIDDAQDVVFRNVPSGQILDLRARFIRASGTTAADLVGLA